MRKYDICRITKKRLIKKELKKKISWIFGTLIGALIGITLAQLLPINISGGGKFSEEELAKAKIEMNKSLPMQIDEYTRADSASFNGEILNYYYTISLSKDKIDVDVLDQNLSSSILQNIKNASELEVFKDRNVTFTYIYRDINSELFYTYKVTADMYNN